MADRQADRAAPRSAPGHEGACIPGRATERSVNIRPIATAADVDARGQGWTRPDRGRTFRLEHRDYGAGPISGFEYDIGAVLVQVTTATGEVQPIAALEVWNLQPKQFLHPWQTDDSK
jgi:hypothetical protein